MRCSISRLSRCPRNRLRRHCRWRVPMSAAACVNWKAGELCGVVHVLGDRRDHFESLKDVWQMFQIIIAERKRREMDPTLAMLRECLSKASRQAGCLYSGADRRHLVLRDHERAVWGSGSRLPKGVLPGLTRLRGQVKKLLVMKGGPDEPRRKFFFSRRLWGYFIILCVLPYCLPEVLGDSSTISTAITLVSGSDRNCWCRNVRSMRPF